MDKAVLPSSIAIAGAWGYIGQKFLHAAQRLRVGVYAFDPGPIPESLDLAGVERVTDEATFYTLPAQIFHLALHPNHRRYALETLFARARAGESFCILNEKPMAEPDKPEHCKWIRQQVAQNEAWLAYDFPELFDPMTARIVDFLRGHRTVQIEEVHLFRSKDRENPNNPRNYKIMVPIQYQETVHCIAFLLTLLGAHSGQLAPVFSKGICAQGQAEIYCPPNPDAYAEPVDGKLEGVLELAGTTAHLHTNFKSGAELTKRRIIRGRADGRPFCIDADYLEGHKYLIIDGAYQAVSPTESSYENVIRQLWSWRQSFSLETWRSGLYPNTNFSEYTYRLSALLWDACREQAPLRIEDASAFRGYMPGFARHREHISR